MFEEIFSRGIDYILAQESVEELLDYLAFSLKIGIFGARSI
jgi:hypothetical protein